MHVDDRSQKNMKYNKTILKDCYYVDDIEFINGNACDAAKILEDNGVSTSSWNPYDGRKSNPLPGEYGVMASTLNLWKYIVSNKIDMLIVLEDDIVLQDDFVYKLEVCLNDLPDDFDFLSCYYFSEQNQIDENTDIGLEYIHKANNQYSAAQCVIYSLNGAKKLLKLLKRKGYEYTNDCFLYRQSHEGSINGYSIKMSNDYFLKHDNKKIKSLIDPSNFRHQGEA